MIFPDNIPLNPLTKGQLWISHYPGKRDIGNKAIQAEMDLLELKKKKNRYCCITFREKRVSVITDCKPLRTYKET